MFCLHVHTYMCYMNNWCVWMLKRVADNLDLELQLVKNQPPCGCWESNRGLLQQQKLLLTTTLSLQPLVFSPWSWPFLIWHTAFMITLFRNPEKRVLIFVFCFSLPYLMLSMTVLLGGLPAISIICIDSLDYVLSVVFSVFTEFDAPLIKLLWKLNR